MNKKIFVTLLFVAALTAGTAAAQPAPFNQAGVTMGHWHINSKDVEANKKLFLAMGGKLFMPGGNPLIMFPGLYINLVLDNEKGDGGTPGSVVNHVGFIVDNVQRRTAEWKAAGVPVLPGNNNRLDQAFVVTPDGVRIEILEDKTQSMPIRNEHVHFFLPETEIPKAQAWYAKTFGGKVGTRDGAPVVDLPGVQLRFAKADTKQAPTRGRVLDHIGFDVKDHPAFVKKIEAEGIKLDEPVRKGATGSTITYITDPWGTRIEIIQRAPLGPEVQGGIAEVNGTKLYYEMAGSGRAIVLLHGGAVDHRAWDDQFTEFAAKYKVIRYDLRGAGKSASPDKPFSNSEDLHQLLRFLKVDKAYLIGISRGGGVAFDFTLEHPEMTEALVLVSANLGNAPRAYTDMFERTTAAGKKNGAAAAARVWGLDPYQGPVREAARDGVLKIMEENLPRFRHFDGSVEVPQTQSYDGPAYKRLSQIRVRTLIVAGAKDAPDARANYDNWAKGIPNAKKVVFPNAAHLVNIDMPKEFNQAVLEFFSKP